jgi:hypothetical protein
MDLNKVREIIERLRGSAKSQMSSNEIRAFVSELARRGTYQTYSLPADLSIHRARQINDKKWFASEVDLRAPPPEKVIDYGRCHSPGRPLCYCSLYVDIALAEVKAKMGEYYVISTFMMSKGSVLIPVGDLDFFRRTGQTYIGHGTGESAKPYENLDHEDWVVSALIDAFLADEFIKPTDQADYKITSVISDVLLNGDLNPRTPIDAIIYPSVAFREGRNFAVLPGAHMSKIRLVEDETKIIEITDVLGYGIFDYRILATLKSVSSDGCLNWESVK